MKPGGVDLDDRHRSKALEVHVGAIEHGKPQAQVGVVDRARADHPVEVQTHRQIHRGGAEGRNQHRPLAADSVGERPVPDKRQTVNDSASAKDEAEVLVRDQGPERVLGDVQVVTTHVQERVGQAERKPVEESPAAKGSRMRRRRNNARGGGYRGHHRKLFRTAVPRQSQSGPATCEARSPTIPASRFASPETG